MIIDIFFEPRNHPEIKPRGFSINTKERCQVDIDDEIRIKVCEVIKRTMKEEEKNN